MNTLYDLIKLFIESYGIATKEAGSSLKWISSALVVASAVFVLNFYFCRLWNRRYDFTVSHWITFSAASILAFFAVFAWPASTKMNEAVNARIKAWVDYLSSSNATIPVTREWADDMKSVGRPIQSKLSWFDALPWKTREYLHQQGYSKGTLKGSTFHFGNDGAATHYEFAEGLRTFGQTNPYLRTRLGFDFVDDFATDNKKSKTYQTYITECDKNRDEEGKISFFKCAEEMGKVVKADLVEGQGNLSKTEKLAKWTRIVGVGLISLSVALPMLISGLVSYLQIRVGHKFRVSRPGSTGRSRTPAPSYRRRLSGR